MIVPRWSASIDRAMPGDATACAICCAPFEAGEFAWWDSRAWMHRCEDCFEKWLDMQERKRHSQIESDAKHGRKPREYLTREELRLLMRRVEVA